MFKQITHKSEWNEMSVSQKGFTLIELLVVIAILGILAVVGVLSFGGLTGTAKNATSKTELTQIQTAVDAYMAKPANNGASPADVAALVTDTDLKAGTTAASLQCAYTITAGVVAFAAVQTGHANCQTT